LLPNGILIKAAEGTLANSVGGMHILIDGNWVLENLWFQAEVWYSMIRVNALSLFTLHGRVSLPNM
jgi:hypothetical protein